MPRISDPRKYKKEAIDREISKVEREVEKEKKAEEAKEVKEGKRKKEPNYPLLYVIIAVLVFGLGLLVIALINFFVEGQFSL